MPEYGAVFSNLPFFPIWILHKHTFLADAE